MSSPGHPAGPRPGAEPAAPLGDGAPGQAGAAAQGGSAAQPRAVPRGSIKARGVERLVRTDCPRERALLAHNLDLVWVARQTLPHLRSLVGKTSYAWRAGHRFEETMLAATGRGGERLEPPLIQGLRQLGLLPERGEVQLVECSIPGRNNPDLSVEEALDRGRQRVLEPLEAQGPHPPKVYSQVTLALQIPGRPQQILRPDALVWTGERWVVVEIKSRLVPRYWGAEPQDLRTRARRQAAVYMLALAQTWAQSQDPEVLAPEGMPEWLDPQVVLVLRWVHYPGWRLEQHPAQGEFVSLRDQLFGSQPSWGDAQTPSPPSCEAGDMDLGELNDWVWSLQHRLSSECLDTGCPLLPGCLQRGSREGNPVAALLAAGDLSLPSGACAQDLVDQILDEDGAGAPLDPLQLQWLRGGWEVADKQVREREPSLFACRQETV
jgi:hypothetical protein